MISSLNYVITYYNTYYKYRHYSFFLLLLKGLCVAMNKKLLFGRYDYAACLTFASYAFCSMAIPICLVPLAIALGFPLADGGMSLGGALQLGRSVPMVIAMALCGFAGTLWGKRKTLGFSVLLMSLGIIGCALAPSYGFVFLALAIAGLGEGVIEGLATPYIQDLHPDQPGRYLNISHSFWSIGVLVVVLGAGGLLYCGVSWRFIVLAVGIIATIPALLFLLPGKSQRREKPDAASSVQDVIANFWNIIKEKRFWLFFAAMFFAGGGEFCLTFWAASFIQIEFGGTAWAAGAGTACFAAGMFIGRFGSGILIHQHNLKKLIVGAAFCATAITLAFPWVYSLWTLCALLLVTGIAAGPFWPSIQSDGARRVKGDYTMMMILFSCAGVPGCGIFTAGIGVLGDWLGLRLSFFLVPASFFLAFLLMAYDLAAEKREKQRQAGFTASAAEKKMQRNPILP